MHTSSKLIVLFGSSVLAIASGVAAQSVSLTTAGFSQHWGTSNPDYDLNGDGVVNAADLSMYLAGVASGESTASGNAPGSSIGTSGGLETPGAASMSAAGTLAPDFLKNSAGSLGSKLSVGGGFAGATTVSATSVDTSLVGADARAIARWDFIPYHTFSEPVNVGVVAFHMAGIDRVSFSANGGPWVDVREMKRNPQTGVWEYYVTIDPAACADGRIEVRAIAWPKVGLPRVLQGPMQGNERLGEHSMILWANAGGSLARHERFVSMNGSDANDGTTPATAVRTIAKAAALLHAAGGGNAGGGFINMLPGVYSWAGSGRDELGATVPNPLTTERWLTVRRAPGTTGGVTFTSSGDGALRTRLLAVHGLAFHGAQPSRPGTEAGSLLWISNSELRGTGRADQRQWIDTGFVGGFLTQTRITNCASGCNRGLLVRDLHLEEIGKDGFVQIPLVLNSTIRGLSRPEGVTWHCDVMQYLQTQLSNPNRNVIIYGFKAFDCRSQGFFTDTDPGAGTNPWRDFALVNYFSEFSQGSNHMSSWCAPVDHLVMRNCTFVGNTMYFRAADGEGVPLTYRNVSIHGSYFTRAGVCTACREALVASGNHFASGVTFGSGATVGDPRFTDPASNDYRPGPGSPLLDRLDIVAVPVDSTLQTVAAPGNIGSFE